ncbi:MAG: hypothetical protein Q7T76_08380 [Ferruginibacter sp.]|nr:hypothetical protein [Ferruginibacter sp.]
MKDSIWQFNRYKPNFLIEVDGATGTIINVTGNISPTSTSEEIIYRKINDTTFGVSGYPYPDTYVRELSSNLLVVYTKNPFQVGIHQIDSLKR